ncbi:MAG: hypothetical protein DKM50_12595 [Candidatus Margulisiibacteriota bacterium]|nr:MAG: hypothetical protein A2X43_11055 [Candidatus Margulisbacteria bacterium GWD2_39_127]OGI02767.1 MAG: hypothetical protein A2X42_01880 [Candidatus Margulisbacteria bacterium GWF2_38_17]OGI09346.1 MAG: hypothetical protein A2X41_09495 [Candidatus Margulisbacteria bacterium GWE2_39_32]PZM77440.1 MAG: hypothetical protein DKM50_12595 [Candidatus Margulisiibacteriota bacterium]HAR63997.1 hypothetical protein [Candidatus Margulisiibacteriota bacterium]
MLKRLISTKLSVFFVCFLCCSYVLASENGAVFLENGGGAKAMAYGDAFGANTGEIWETLYNPAGIYGIKNAVLESMYQSIFIDTNYKSLAVAVPFQYGTFATHYYSAGVSNIPETQINSEGRPEATGELFSYISTALLISYATDFSTKKIFAGCTLKFIDQKLWDNSSSGYGMDIGIIWALDNSYRFGISAINILKPALKWNTFNESLDTAPLKIIGAFDYKSIDAKVRVRASIKKITNRPYTYHFGVGYRLIDELELRGGMNEGQSTFGLGISLGPVNFDYAVMASKYNEVGNLQRFSFGYQFSLPEKKMKTVLVPETIGTANTIPTKSVELNVDSVLTTNNNRQSLPISDRMYSPEEKKNEYPDGFTVLINQANAAFINEEYEKAIELLLQSLQFDDKRIRTYIALGASYLNLDQKDRAREYWDKTLTLDPGNESIKKRVAKYFKINTAPDYYQQGYVYFNDRNYEKAIGEYKKAIAIDPKFELAYLWLGNSYKMLGQSDEARKSWTKGGKTIEEESDRFYEHGYVCFIQQDYKSAIDSYLRAIELNPASIKAYVWLGNMYIRLDQKEHAVDIWSKALKLAPDNEELQFKLSLYLSNK